MNRGKLGVTKTYVLISKDGCCLGQFSGKKSEVRWKITHTKSVNQASHVKTNEGKIIPLTEIYKW